MSSVFPLGLFRDLCKIILLNRYLDWVGNISSWFLNKTPNVRFLCFSPSHEFLRFDNITSHNKLNFYWKCTKMSHFRHNETTKLAHNSCWASGVERSHGWVIIIPGLSPGCGLGWAPDGSMAHLDTTGHQSHGRWPGNCAQVARQLVISQYCSFSAAECRSS